MTTEADRFKEFMARCVNPENGQPGATRIDDPAARRREAARSRSQSEYHAMAVQDNLEGRAPLKGYYVMLHKANEALSLAGFKSRTHECTLLGIRGVFNSPVLADMLRRAFDERRNVDYFIDPDNPDLEEFAGPEQFVEDVMDQKGLGTHRAHHHRMPIPARAGRLVIGHRPLEPYLQDDCVEHLSRDRSKSAGSW